MDKERFINFVYEHKCLWDPSDLTYHLRDNKRKAWMKISEEMKIPSDDLQRKWRSLRDTFGKELKKINHQKSDADSESKWQYFKRLMFLQETMTRKDLKSSVVDISDTSDTDEKARSDGERFPSPSADLDYDEPPPKKYFKNPQNNSKIQHCDDMNAKLIRKIKQEKLKLLQQTGNYNQDSDAQFLMSLLPFLKDIPKHRKLMVRTKLQQVLLTEQDELTAADRLEVGIFQ